MAPTQLFDFSDHHAQNSFSRTKGSAAPDEENNGRPPELFTDDAEAFARFDWDKFAREFALSMPPDSRETLQQTAMVEEMTLHAWLGQRLPTLSVEWMLLHAPTKGLWGWINHKVNVKLKTEIFKGFQQTPNLIKHPTIRGRLLRHFESGDRVRIMVLLHYWGSKDPIHPTIALLQAEEDDAVIKHRLPAMLKKYQFEELLCAAAYCCRVHVFKAIYDLIQSGPEHWKEIMDAEPVEEPAPTNHPESPKPDTAIAEWWRDKSNHFEEKCGELEAQIEKTRQEAATLRETNRAALAEADQAKKLDKQHTATLGKKIEHLTKGGAEKLAELRKNYERETRRLHAAQRQIEELESSEKNLKKQFARLQIHLAEERKKVAVLEAKLAAQNTPDGAESNAIEALSTPATTQKSKLTPVVVSAPTPLDETFRWVADGHQVRVTPREVRRLIDANDEDGVFRIVWALEAIEKRDPTTRNRFLTRLKDAGEFYPLVLTQPTRPVLVDASNVARYQTNRFGKGIFKNLLTMRDELRRLHCFPIVFIADASLRHFIDEPAKFAQMVRENQIQVTDKGVEADEILTREARKTSASVVTNDANFHQKVSPDFAPSRASFRIYDGTVIVDDF